MPVYEEVVTQHNPHKCIVLVNGECECTFFLNSLGVVYKQNSGVRISRDDGDEQYWWFPEEYHSVISRLNRIIADLTGEDGRYPDGYKPSV